MMMGPIQCFVVLKTQSHTFMQLSCGVYMVKLAHYSCALTQGCCNGYVTLVIVRFCPYLSQLTSQHAYTQEHIGPPHVYTINMADLPQVEKVVKEIIKREVGSLFMS